MVMPAPSTFKALQPGIHLSLGDGVTRHILERAGHTGTAVGEHVYIMGGRRGSRYYTDLLRLNVKDKVWEKVYSQMPFHPRANHIAVAVKHNIWVFGGSDNKIVLSDIWVLDTNTLHWTQPQLSGRPDLLCRCAAGADLAPNNASCIIVCGGYGLRHPDMVAYDYYNDIVVIDTQRMRVDQIEVSGIPPSPRCFHTFTTVGNRCYLLGGRRLDEANRVLEVAVYDSARSAWVDFRASGEPPHPRSSHRAISLGDRLLLTGGIIDDASRHMDADLVVTLHTGDDHSPVAQLEWSTEDQPQRCFRYDWPQGRGGHSCCLVKNQVLLLLGYTGYENKVYLPEVLSFEVCLPSPPSKPVSPATTAGLASPRATQPEPLVTPALHHPAPVGPYPGLVVHATHHRIARHTSTVGHVPASPLVAGPRDAKAAKQARGARDITAEAEEELDEYDVSNVPSVDPAPHLVRQSRTGTGRAAKPIDLTADDKAEERGKKAGKGGKQGGGPSRLHGRSPVRSPAREEVVPGSPGEGGWRLSKGANRASQAALLPQVDEESEQWAHKRQRTGRSPGPAAGRLGPGDHRSGAGASPADAAALGQPAATRGQKPADAQTGASGRRSPGRVTKAPNQVERLQADVQRLQEDLKRSLQSEAEAEEQAKVLKATLEHQRTNFESECALLRTKLAEKDAIVQSKAGELLSTQQAYGEAVRQVKDHQLQMDRKQHEVRELAAENAKLNQDYTVLNKRLNDAEVRTANAEAKVSSLEIELRRSHLEAQAAMEEAQVQLRQRQASYEKVQLSYDTLTDHQAKSVARVAELQDQLARHISEANEAKHKAAQQLLELSAARDAEQRVAEAAKAEARGLQQRNGMLELNLGRQNAAVDDLQRQLSAATAELTQAKASLRTTKEELEALKCRHENLVKAGVEIAQDLRGPLETICHARDRSAVFEDEDARMQIQEKQQQSRQQAQQQAQQMVEHQQRQLQQQQQQHQQQQQQQQQSLLQTELQVPQFPLALQPSGSNPQGLGLPGSSILGPPPQICSIGASIPGNPGPSNAVT